MHRVTVCNNDKNRYPAYVDADERHGEGWVRPYFDVDTVRELAANTQAEAAQFGHGSIDTVHVIDGGTNGGYPRVVVAVICWMDIETKGIDGATAIVEPIRVRDDEDGDDPDGIGEPLYPVGGFEWCWYAMSPDGIHPQIPFKPEQ
ncbi:hypothetical protein [Streptomyces sp. BH104]|uniref:hypothetical protein n=1 Tax=Streptomyces sp. BH104 TaxID=3410407 RepID=UPI003BB619F1